MQRERKYEATTPEYFCDRCGKQIHDHRCTCEQCGSDFCEDCRGRMRESEACEFCPPELQAIQTQLDALWDKANKDADKLWKRRHAVLDRLRKQQKLSAADRGVHADKLSAGKGE